MLTLVVLPLQAQFFPFFILTLTGIVTIPLTYSLLRPNTDDAHLAPRIKTDYKAPHDDLVKGLRSAQKRKMRKVKRAIVTIGGWSLMGFMVYLIMTTTPTVHKIWNPYDILGISEVQCRYQTPSTH